MELKLEVGKKYLTRDEEVVQISDFNPSDSWAYSGMLHGVLHKWFENGKWWINSIEHKYDIVFEYTPPNEETKA